MSASPYAKPGVEPDIVRVNDAGCYVLPEAPEPDDAYAIPFDPQLHNAWIEKGQRCVYLCYWLNGRGNEVRRLRFGRALDAQRFYAWNMNDTLCEQCWSEPKVGWSHFCPDCRDQLALLDDLERRWNLATTAYQRQQSLGARVEELRSLLGEDGFTDADKAAVLDRLLSEANEVGPDAESREGDLAGEMLSTPPALEDAS